MVGTETLEPAARAARGSWRRTSWFGALVVMSAALLARLPGFLHQLMDLDESAIATTAMVVNRGGVLYRDVIDRKPPIPSFVYAGSFLITGNRDLRPLRVLAALALGASALVLAWGAKRVAGAVAGWWSAGLLLAGATTLQPHDAQAANFAHLALLPGCCAIVAARVGSRRSAALAGCFVGVATLTRQTWIIGVVPAAFAAWSFGGRRWERAAIVVGATTLTIASVALVVPWSGFWDWVFADNGSVLDIGGAIDVGHRAAITLEFFLLANLATCWLVARRGWRRTDLDLWLWLAGGVVAFAAGFRFFGHYWLQALPPLCLLGGLGAAACPSRTRRLLVAVVAVPALAAWTVAFVVPPDIGGRVVPPLVEYIRAHTRAGDLVTVWGDAPDVYWRTGRSPGGALISTDFVVGKAAWRTDGKQRLADATPGARAIFLRSLRAHPPKLFLDTSTANFRGYGNYPLRRIPSVKAFVDANYRRVATRRGVTIYARTTSPPRR
ncbi:MAG: hypothetical protein QOF40_1453 [Actinomycetota bacterium]|nr:hypothetical protein [Actinomycetota bacterium]